MRAARQLRFALIVRAVAFLLLAFNLSAATIPDIPDYRVGDIATEDVVTPVKLIFTERSVSPVIESSFSVVFDDSAAREAEMALRQMFNRIRLQFLENLFTATKQRTLTASQLQHPGFERFVKWFHEQHKDFPLNQNIAEIWATGDPADAIKEDWASRLRTAMTNKISADAISFEAHSEAMSNVMHLTEAKVALARTFESQDQAAATFVSEFLRANCRLENPTPAPSKVLVTEHWIEPGQIVVQRGEVVDRRAKTAIELLREKRAEQERAAALQEWINDFRLLGVTLREYGETAVASLQSVWRTRPEFIIGSGVGLLLLVSITRVLRFRRRPRHSTRVVNKEAAYTVIINQARNETIFLPLKTELNSQLIVRDTASSGGELLPTRQSSRPQSELEWEERVLATEKRAHELLMRVREGLAPELARQMMNELVRKLIADRAGLLQAQNIASDELAALEGRFAKVQSDLLERLKQYQQRNQELERELAARIRENEKLLATQIETLHRKLK